MPSAPQNQFPLVVTIFPPHRSKERSQASRTDCGSACDVGRLLGLGWWKGKTKGSRNDSERNLCVRLIIRSHLGCVAEIAVLSPEIGRKSEFVGVNVDI
ncbi:hypothetical protein JTE90_025875 [Oedothorax gibbosus]|uniref:Uncharacterized protein n=1 Tax=Oedothorax gibbosus TaxID=931172 RepID=A0AAV6UNC5_9ARAC|nr:hypothetical protein JTE90_025875 [Oedothorax gibbosus]